MNVLSGILATSFSFSGANCTTLGRLPPFLLGKTKLRAIIKGKHRDKLQTAAALPKSLPPPVVQAEMSVSVEVRFIEVGADWDGQRLDNFLFREVKGVPKTHIYRLIRSGQIRINKGRVQADTRLQSGDVIRIPPVRVAQTPPESADHLTPPREFPVLFEDEFLIAINKPAGVAVHGGSGVSFGVIEQLRRARPEARFLELVHRLDRETSGILLVAKKRSALVQLQDQFRARETGKTYLALVKGSWPAKLKVVDTPLRKFLLPDGERRVRTTDKDDPEGMRAISLVHVQKSWPHHASVGMPATSLLAVTIKTGRTHQIRVHLTSSGHPIAGDDKYGDFDWNKRLPKFGLDRMFLHAWKLAFNHPHDGHRVELECLPGADLQKIQNQLNDWAAL